jgi:hypothetical protein
MRLRALLVGFSFISAVALWHRSSVPSNQAGFGPDPDCRTTDPFGLCGAIASLSAAFHDPLLRAERAGILPPAATPGAVDPAITQADIDLAICRPGYAGAARPTYVVTAPLKRRMMKAQHPGEAMADYELDHLIPISIGGAPLEGRNLWLQPRRGQANAADKNALAYVLWRLVCEHRLPLRTAQTAISRDWTKAYNAYATPQNLAKYRFRHAEADHD